MTESWKVSLKIVCDSASDLQSEFVMTASVSARAEIGSVKMESKTTACAVVGMIVTKAIIDVKSENKRRIIIDLIMAAVGKYLTNRNNCIAFSSAF